MNWKIKGNNRALKGDINVPPDKSISHRAIMFGAISRGKVRVKNFLFAEDCMRTFQAFRAMGCQIERDGDDVLVVGAGLGGLRAPDKELYLGNSGTTMRIISGIIAGCGIPATLTGDESLSRRPMGRIIDPLKKMGVIVSAQKGGLPPLRIEKSSKTLNSIAYKTPVASAQVKSCILSAGLYASGETSVTEPFQSRDHTERILRHFSADIECDGLTTKIRGMKELVPSDITVPGDISSAAFFMVGASVIEGSDIVLKSVGLNPTRRGIIDVMLRMGANITIIEERGSVEREGDIRIKASALKGTIVQEEEIPLLIDEVPILIIAALSASGETRISGVSELKVKESDRVKCMTENLARMGYEIFEDNGDLVIPGGQKDIKNADFDSHGDHRIAMSMAMASLKAAGESVVKDTSCVDTSYPGFIKDLEGLRK